MKEGIEPDEKKRTIFVTSQDSVDAIGAMESRSMSSVPHIRLFERLRWSLLGWLRRHSDTPANVLSSNILQATPVDDFVASNCSTASIYRRQAIQELVGVYFWAHNSNIVEGVDLIFRVALIGIGFKESGGGNECSPGVLSFLVHIWAFTKD
jgi:hypothetical protein